jgi:hypothetical protein
MTAAEERAVMAGKSTQGAEYARRKRGFERAGGLLASRIRQAGEGRGFAVSRLLTHWAEVAGEEMASVTRPVRISYGRNGFGATLTLLTTGAQAPLVQAELGKLKDRVNACYGYAAISRITLTQTAPEGFAEGRADFDHAARKIQPAAPEPGQAEIAAAAGVADDDLRAALENMGAAVHARQKTK